MRFGQGHIEPFAKAPERSSMHMNFNIKMFVFGHRTTGKAGFDPSRDEPVDSSTNADEVCLQNLAMPSSCLPDPACTTMQRSATSGSSVKRRR